MNNDPTYLGGCLKTDRAMASLAMSVKVGQEVCRRILSKHSKTTKVRKDVCLKADLVLDPAGDAIHPALRKRVWFTRLVVYEDVL